jgi:hypothetical protein
MKRHVMILTLWGLIFTLGGCGEDRYLRVISAGQQENQISLWVANGSHRSQDTRPRILDAGAQFDGQPSDVKGRIEVFNSKLGWSETVTFAAPTSAKAARIVAVVESDGQQYTVMQDWRRMAEVPSSNRNWKPGESSIVLCTDQGMPEQ